MTLEAAKRIDSIFDVELDVNGLSADKRLRVSPPPSLPQSSI